MSQHRRRRRRSDPKVTNVEAQKKTSTAVVFCNGFVAPKKKTIIIRVLYSCYAVFLFTRRRRHPRNDRRDLLGLLEGSNDFMLSFLLCVDVIVYKIISTLHLNMRKKCSYIVATEKKINKRLIEEH